TMRDGDGTHHVERGLRKEQSGKNGGRAKEQARITRELLGDDGEAAIRFLAVVMEGGPLPDGAVPSVSERITAAKLLIERGWGRAPEFAPVEDRDPLELRAGDEELAASFDRRMDELAEKRVERQRQRGAKCPWAPAGVWTSSCRCQPRSGGRSLPPKPRSSGSRSRR